MHAAELYRRPDHISGPRLLRLPEVLGVTGLGRSQIYTLMAEGRFPASVPITTKNVGCVESEVFNWIESRIAARGTVARD